MIGCRHHSSSMRQDSPSPSTVLGTPHVSPTRRETLTRRPSASCSTRAGRGALSTRSKFFSFRIPHSALWFIVDQRVAAFGDARPWLDGDDVVQHRALEPELDLVDGGA